MKSYLVAYELRDDDGDEARLHDAIKALAGDCWRYLGNVWLISTSSTAVTIRDRLRAHLAADDELFVISLGANWATHNMSSDNTDWLRMRLIPEAEAVLGNPMVGGAIRPAPVRVTGASAESLPAA